jgi:hypothetical protein
MPRPVTEPSPLPAFRLSPPDETQEASYFAASAKISSFCNVLRRNTDLSVHFMFYPIALSWRKPSKSESDSSDFRFYDRPI